MLLGIIKFILKLVDIDVYFNENVLTLKISFAGKVIIDRKFDLFDGEDVKKVIHASPKGVV